MTDPPPKRARTIASQACDSCRHRKIKCDFGEAKDHDRRSWSASAPAPPRLRCRGCIDVDIPCTFDMPVKRRGPPSKLARAGSGGASSSQRLDHGSPQAHARPREDLQNGELRSPSMPGNGSYNSLQHQSSPLFHLRYASQAEHEDFSGHMFPTDRICPRSMFDAMMQDYIDLIYPLVPVVHKPSFIENLRKRRESYDPTFLAMVTAICATLVAHIPSRFYYYRSAQDPLRFTSRYAMVEFCHDFILSLQRPDTLDQPTQTTWATSYLLGLAYVHLGRKGQGRTLFITAENVQQAYMQEFHSAGKIAGLNCIERQLRKKAFWLCFFGYVHHQLEVLPILTAVYQPDGLATLDFEDLLPFEIDDEYITADSYGQQPSSIPSITAGFNANCRIFWAAVSDATNHVISPQQYRATLPLDLQLSSLQIRLQSTKQALDTAHPKLTQWSIASPPTPNTAPEDELREGQWESMRANTHISHLWLQSMLFEHIVALTERIQQAPSPAGGMAALTSRTLWNSREDICRSLLLVLYNLNASNLEPNGNVLVHKVRTVATTLLDCPFELQGDVARRANGYIAEFAGVLAGIDRSDDNAGAGERYWSEVDGLGRRALREFAGSISDAGSLGGGIMS